MPRQRIDLTGMQFGLLVAVSEVRPANTRTAWECRCECGSIITVRSTSLTEGNTKSCGCLRIKNLRNSRLTHGGGQTPEYKIWKGMISRCENPAVKSYEKYGACGIKVCDRWRSSFDSFIEDMGARPSTGHSIDRIKNEKGYEPGNCRWATKVVQNRNRVNTVWIEYNGERLPSREWAKRIGVSPALICRRVKQGLTVEQILSPPTRGKR